MNNGVLQSNDVNSNRITDLKPFPSDIKMRRLQLSDNLMSELKRESFASLNYLIDADFSKNKIKRVDPYTFNDLPGFITLELQGNPLDPVGGIFLSSRSLMYLDISNCGLTHLNSQFFLNISALTTLDLSENPLNEITDLVFKPLISLEILKMNRCNLTTIYNNAFESQTHLKTLELQENTLTVLDWRQVFGQLLRLTFLDLNNAHITNIPENAFDNNVYLRTLVLANNKLAGFDVASTLGQKLRELDTLDLSYCNLDKPLSEDAFSNSTKLRVLNLSGNFLFASDLLVALAPLSGLQKLDLSNCGLNHLPDTFDTFKSLRQLDISNNPLRNVFIKLLTPIKSLEYLNMGYSNLTYITPTCFSKMKHMKHLILSGNQLHLGKGLFKELTHLQTLELNNCGLREPLNATLFLNNVTYTDLTELQFSGNSLRIPKSGPLLPRPLSELRTVDLSNCNMTYLPTDAFFWTRNITHLVLYGNKFIRADGLSFLKLLPLMEVIDLRNNNLTSIHPNTFAENTHLQQIQLYGNPWKCDCSIAELWDWVQLELGSLEILEGAIVKEKHMKVGKSKNKKLLTCHYDTNVQMPLLINGTAAGRRPFLNPERTLTSAKRTWAKYVRESGCAQKVNRAKRSTRYNRYDFTNDKVSVIVIDSSLDKEAHVDADINVIVSYPDEAAGVQGTYCKRRKKN
ncbi:hypothetical protein RN001_015597 [Aquatica leii]|uniref:Uncharacterized protein n=1 Tax=Aquatica leii TaxID=1421715 RepID=A0AAN7QAP4_9COLE|nr:hypothetical protein RN001_015597 [Aquatica leii]